MGSPGRLATLRRYLAHDTAPDPAFDEIVNTAARLFQAPIALISLIGRERQQIRAQIGLAADQAERELTVCAVAARRREVVIVPDAAADPRFAGDPLVAGLPGIRFCAAAPLITADGHPIGALLVADTAPRPLRTKQECGALEALARVVVGDLDTRRAAHRTAILSARLERLARLALQFTGCDDAACLLRSTAAEILPLFGAGIASMSLALDAGPTLRETAGIAGPADAAAVAGAIQLLEQLAGGQPGPLRLDLAELRERAARAGQILPASLAAAGWMAVPFRGEEGYGGTIVVAADEPFEPEDEALLVQLAQLLSGALRSRVLLERAQAAEAYLRVIFQSNPNPMWLYDRETLRFLEMNDAGVAFYGWSRDELRGMTILDLRPQGDVPLLLESMARMDSGMVHRGEWRQVRRGGDIVDVLLGAYNGLDYGGRSAVLAVAHDITDRKKMERALAESEARIRDIADSIPGMLWMTDAADRTIFVNRQWRTYTGCMTDDETGNSWMARVHPDDLDDVLTAAREGSAATTPYEVTYRLRRHDGTYRWFLDRASPRLAEDGSLLGYVGVALDVTDRRRLEAELRQSQKLEAVGKLTGGLAHDFNNLLTVIIGSNDLLTESLADDAKLRGLAEMTRSAADRGAGLIKRLLAFSRGQNLQPEVTDIGQLIRATIPMLRLAVGKDVAVTLELPATLWPVNVDSEQVATALLNLAINGSDAMAESGRVTIRAENVSAADGPIDSDERVTEGDFVSISVLDTGCGMAADVAARAFEPFFTTKETGKGTGLGLSMVYGFVKQSGGYVGLTSAPGQGTEVRILLPRAAADQEQALPFGSSPAQARSLMISSASMR